MSADAAISSNGICPNVGFQLISLMYFNFSPFVSLSPQSSSLFFGTYINKPENAFPFLIVHKESSCVHTKPFIPSILFSSLSIEFNGAKKISCPASL